MCGIVGAFSLDGVSPVSADLVARMNETLLYRGPDDGGVHVRGPIGLGNRRLAIVDRALGRQPMPNPEATRWITYNGEVYNHRELRADLEGRGYRFRTHSDTEVVLQAYDAWGEACVERFNGQFAFAVWDEREGELFLARDHLGIAPLHYAVADGLFLFASEAKALFAHPAVEPRIDPEAIAEAFLCGTLFAGRTMFQDVQALEPGTRLKVNRNGVRKAMYWDIPLREDPPRSEAEYADQLLPLLEDALRIRLPEEVPWGLMLSGGTDSSTLVHMARGMSASPPQTFTIDFPNPWKGKDMDVHYARLLAERLGTRHREFLIAPDEYYDLLREVTWHVERPFNKGAVTMYMLYRQIKEHATVVITGEGADELFAGYVGSRGLGLDEVVATGRITRLPWAAYWEDTARLFSARLPAQGPARGAAPGPARGQPATGERSRPAERRPLPLLQVLPARAARAPRPHLARVRSRGAPAVHRPPLRRAAVADALDPQVPGRADQVPVQAAGGGVPAGGDRPSRQDADADPPGPAHDRRAGGAHAASCCCRPTRAPPATTTSPGWGSSSRGAAPSRGSACSRCGRCRCTSSPWSCCTGCIRERHPWLGRGRRGGEGLGRRAAGGASGSFWRPASPDCSGRCRPTPGRSTR